MSFQRHKILKPLLARGCRIVRDAGPHTVVMDPSGRTTSVPRHREVNRNTTRCDRQGIRNRPGHVPGRGAMKTYRFAVGSWEGPYFDLQCLDDPHLFAQARSMDEAVIM